jgi:hypothetical protein
MRIKKIELLIIAGILLNALLVHVINGYPRVYPTGVTTYFPRECWGGYTLVPYEPGPILLIDMNGRVVHRWNLATERATLLPDGHVVIMKGSKVLEYDWDGNLVWQYKVPSGPIEEDYYPTPGIIHHDLERLPNGNTIFLYHEEVPSKYKKLIKDPKRRAVKLIGDCISEVNRDGKVVWEWHGYNHLDLNDYSKVDGIDDWTHTNSVQVLQENHWYNEGYKEFKPGNVMISIRHLNLVVIIERDTKKIVWKYKGDYMGGMAHQHEARMIKVGMPGAGNILIFDNGVGAPGSSGHDGMTVVFELNPVTNKIVWKYEDGTDFFSAIQGTEERLPNGNTFISESCSGTLYEVTPGDKVVWEYVMPPLPGSVARHGFGTRPHRYGYDYCPQLKEMPLPEELAVIPPKNGEWHLKPDLQR